MNRGLTLVLAGLLGWTSSAQAAPAVVIVDVGHSAQAPGSTSAYGRPEYGFNAQLGRLLVSALRARGVDARLREGHATLTGRTAGTDGAQLFVSIHHDSIQQAWLDQGRREEFSGFSVFVSAKNPAFEKSLMCARRVGRAMAADGERPSLYHATPILGENRPLLDKPNGVHRYDNLVVLKAARSPAILIEAGVIVNPHEDRRLGEPATAQRLAGAMADGIAGCLAQAP